MLSHYIMVGLGGGLGAVARVLLSQLMPLTFATIPIPILVVNILGCFLIGVFSEAFALHGNASDTLRYFAIPGFLGGFTTFSSFALEFGNLVERNDYVSAGIYAIASFALCILSFFIGLKALRLL